jgi:hypothetical protein
MDEENKTDLMYEEIKKELIEELMIFFKEKNITIPIDSIKSLKINKEFMANVYLSSFSTREINKIIKDLPDYIDFSFFKYNKYNPKIVHDLCNIIFFFIYLFFSNNKEINTSINGKISKKEYEVNSGHSYSNYLNNMETDYDRISNRILYMIIVYVLNKVEMTDDIRKMFESITNYSLGLLNDNNEENIFTIKYKCFLDDRPCKDHLPNDLLNDPISKEINGCMVFTRHDTIGMDDLTKNCKCTEELTDQEKIINGNMCSECRRRMHTSNFPFIIFKMNGKFYLNDLARNFAFFDCKKKEKLKICTQIQANEVNTYNYGTSTIVLQV